MAIKTISCSSKLPRKLYQFNFIGIEKIKNSFRARQRIIAFVRIIRKSPAELFFIEQSCQPSVKGFVFTAVCKSHGGQVINGSREKSDFAVGTLYSHDTKSRQNRTMHSQNAAPNCTIIVRRFRESHSSTEGHNHVHCRQKQRVRFFASCMWK